MVRLSDIKTFPIINSINYLEFENGVPRRQLISYLTFPIVSFLKEEKIFPSQQNLRYKAENILVGEYKYKRAFNISYSEQIIFSSKYNFPLKKNLIMQILNDKTRKIYQTWFILLDNTNLKKLKILKCDLQKKFEKNPNFTNWNKINHQFFNLKNKKSFLIDEEKDRIMFTNLIDKKTVIIYENFFQALKEDDEKICCEELKFPTGSECSKIFKSGGKYFFQIIIKSELENRSIYSLKIFDEDLNLVKDLNLENFKKEMKSDWNIQEIFQMKKKNRFLIMLKNTIFELNIKTGSSKKFRRIRVGNYPKKIFYKKFKNSNIDCIGVYKPEIPNGLYNYDVYEEKMNEKNKKIINKKLLDSVSFPDPRQNPPQEQGDNKMKPLLLHSKLANKLYLIISSNRVAYLTEFDLQTKKFSKNLNQLKLGGFSKEQGTRYFMIQKENKILITLHKEIVILDPESLTVIYKFKYPLSDFRTFQRKKYRYKNGRYISEGSEGPIHTKIFPPFYLNWQEENSEIYCMRDVWYDQKKKVVNWNCGKFYYNNFCNFSHHCFIDGAPVDYNNSHGKVLTVFQVKKEKNGKFMIEIKTEKRFKLRPDLCSAFDVMTKKGEVEIWVKKIMSHGANLTGFEVFNTKLEVIRKINFTHETVYRSLMIPLQEMNFEIEPQFFNYYINFFNGGRNFFFIPNSGSYHHIDEFNLNFDESLVIVFDGADEDNFEKVNFVRLKGVTFDNDDESLGRRKSIHFYGVCRDYSSKEYYFDDIVEFLKEKKIIKIDG